MSLGGKDITEVAYFVEGQMVGCLGKLTRIAIPFFFVLFFFFFSFGGLTILCQRVIKNWASVGFKYCLVACRRINFV